MSPRTKRNLLLIGNDTNLGYLLGRYAEQSQYELVVAPEAVAVQEIAAARPAAAIFLSMKLLEESQALVAALAGLEMPVLVCASIADETRARELGADFCLLHPLTLNGFESALTLVEPANEA
ncbi:MAG: hypothetical protein ACOYYS_25845 [Chloroflexota bacterium]